MNDVRMDLGANQDHVVFWFVDSKGAAGFIDLFSGDVIFCDPAQWVEQTIPKWPHLPTQMLHSQSKTV